MIYYLGGIVLGLAVLNVVWLNVRIWEKAG